ncbi:patatin-like phospholipase family protein [Oleiagrimonas soli]|uniref:NTE family protein n=1 Tax=Oleiagrimonas soli TaxID=1543381 RepID=A0A841KML2_9GAMM|nr:patatin-like phospholipase family protein [Oleiagrimonas soli]MBB6185069.1 NTE family protein [Oleiagrimonas soli]
MKDAPISMAAVADRPLRIALALGAGGAKGLTYIGVIEELERRGFEIVAIAGSSMGALIGGIYAAGKLDVYRDWVCSLARIDVLRLVDWTLSGGGLIKGERIIETLRSLIGEIDIEQLPMTYTAVATDIDRRREIWLTQGPLFDAIRASIAIPSIFRPHHIDGRRLVDGGLLNPLPVTPLLGASWDYMVAVGVNGPIEALPAQTERAAHEDEHEHADSYRKRIADFVGKLMPKGEEKEHEPGALELLSQSLDVMQANLAQLRLAAYQPDLLIEMPANVSTAYEFHRARELIELGRTRADRILENWTPHHLHGSHASVDDAEADPDESASA